MTSPTCKLLKVNGRMDGDERVALDSHLARYHRRVRPLISQEKNAISSCRMAAPAAKGPPSDRRHESVLRGTGLDDSPSTVAGIDLFTTTHESEGFQKGNIPLHRFPVPPECHSEF
jgi:hypothetical protein